MNNNDNSQLSIINSQFKMTEVGVIPEDWRVCALAEVCSRITDGTHDTPTPSQAGKPFLTAIHVKENFIDYDSCLFLTEDEHKIIFSRCNPQNGDVLMVNIGAGVATTAYVDVDFEFSLKNVALLKPKASQVNGRFLNQTLIKRKLGITQALSSGGAQPFLSLSQIGQIKIPVPPIIEQRAIATALSDVDALLAAQDRLIAKKRDIKQAAMQQLLTGKQRLPGFQLKTGYKQTEIGETPVDWDVKTVADFAEVKGGKRLPLGKSLTDKTTPHPYIRVTDMKFGGVTPDDIKYVPEDVFPAIKNYRISSSDIFISVAGTLGIVGKIPDSLDGANLTENANKISSIRCDRDFLLYNLMSERIQNLIASASTVGAQPKLALNQIQSFTLAFPPAIEEQTAIAAVLSDMDADVAALEQQRDKTRALKLGMMQVLLTGKIRLTAN